MPLLDYLLLFIAQFAGGPGPVENNLVRFGLAAVLWGVLLAVALPRRRSQAQPREKALTWGFGIGMLRELFMLAMVSERLLRGSEGVAHALHQPVEHALSMASIVVVAGAFLRYILDDARLSQIYTYVGLGVTLVCLAVSLVIWPQYLVDHPDAQFHSTWGAWLFHAPVPVLIAAAILFLRRKRGWLSNVVTLALTFFFFGEFLFLLNYATEHTYSYVFCRIGNAFHILAIPLLGYVYFREMGLERTRAQKELIALNAIATTISGSTDLDHMLNAILDRVIEIVPASAGWVRLLDEEGGTVSLAAERISDADGGRSQQLQQWSQRLTEKVLQSGLAVVENNGPASRRLDGMMGQQGSPEALICVPVSVRGTMAGSLCVLVPFSGSTDEHEEALLTAIGHQIGVAVENAWLAQEAAQAEIWKELNRLRSELIANVSHEVRTPLGLIKLSCTSLLAEDVEFSKETMQTFLRGIDQETDRLEGIVDNLLDLSQIESGRLRLEKQQTNVAQLAQEVIESINVQAPGHRIVHNFVEPLWAYVDRQRMEQVLRNLLSNAIKYSPDSSVILLQGYSDRGQVHIEVSDEGPGIPSEDLERVFERFYRVENEKTASIGGVGLGLSVCRRIVEAHGGRVWVESDVGVGSTFYVDLPIGVEDLIEETVPSVVEV